MNAALLVFLGGGLGSLARYGVSALASRLGAVPPPGAFPWSTFAVNAIGSLALGVLLGASAERAPSDSARAFLGVGVLGGFTTYSTFNHETLALLDARGAAVAAGYVLSTVATCLVLGCAGAALARRLAGAG